MKYTSAEAAKLLRRLTEEQAAWKEKEQKTSTFVAALQEDVESVRPAYDFTEVQKKLNQLEQNVRAVKHAINVFNCTTLVPGFDMTIDQMLVYIPQLSEQKRRLGRMGAALPKQRVDNRYAASNIVENTYANYDIAKAEEELAMVSEELAKAQTTLDLVNSTATMEIEL